MKKLLNTLQMAALALFATAVLLAMATTVSAQPHAAEPIRIGVAVGLSGANSVVAPAVVQSSQLAVEEINANGGILGRPVQLEIMDDASGAEGAQKAVEALVFGKKVHTLIAMQTSAARNAALPIVARGQLPYIYTSFYEGRSCSPWMYVNAWVPEQQVAPVVEYLAHNRNARSFFLVGSDYAFGRGMLEFARQTLRKGGGQVVGEEYLPVDGSDWAAVIAKIRTARPDAIISATAGGAPNVSLARQLKAADVRIPLGNLSIDESTAREMGSAATGMLMAASYFPSIDTAHNRSFRMRMLVRFGADLKAPNELSVPQYEAFFQYKAAVEAAGSTDAAKVIKALGEVTVTGPRGTLRMGKGRHTPLAMRLGQVRSDGSIRILETYASVDPGAQCPQME
ncbi:substrate-binding protein [Acidovorax sp. Leaf78]|uniref:substrate-binding protein n=1 Tax=Acidovorax sp. Leaf78 TaxID=1736237 RepID=UPI0006FCE6BE|nr:amino acid ABC transporter [Acidovorax sp. Leaf78]